MRQHFLPLIVFCVLSTMVFSCSKDKVEQNRASDSSHATTSDKLSGVYTFAELVDSGYVFYAMDLHKDNSLEFYIEFLKGEKPTGSSLTGSYTYDANTGLGELTYGSGFKLPFFADSSGFIAVYDDVSDIERIKNGMWLQKEAVNLEALKYKEKEPIVWAYPDSLGCAVYDSTYTLITEDIGYQDNSGSTTKAGVEWTLASLGKWAGSSFASGAVGALASAGVNAILTEVGVGMGAEVREISKKLDELSAQIAGLYSVLDKQFKKIQNSLDEDKYNRHREEVNTLANTIDPYFHKVMEETSSAKRMEYLKEFNQHGGTILTATFLDNISSLRYNETDLYAAFDATVYSCHPWEEDGYTERESFRGYDMVTALQGTMLSALYYYDINDTVMVKKHFDKFAKYLDYYNKRHVVRDEKHSVSQIPGLKVKINKEIDRRDFEHHSWLTEVHCNFLCRIYPYNWLECADALKFFYGNNRNIIPKEYFTMGLTEDEINKLIAYYGNKESLYNILVCRAHCNEPAFTYDETHKYHSLPLIVRGRQSNFSIGFLQSQAAIITTTSVEMMAYGPDNKFEMYPIGKPKKVSTLFSNRFCEWESYDTGYVWFYPTAER